MKEKIIEILKYSTRIMENENHTDYLIDNIDEVADEIVKLCTIPNVICSPILAKIEHINDLGKTTWYEVVYYDDKWYSYLGSKTFEDGEQVVDWKYAKDCL